MDFVDGSFLNLESKERVFKAGSNVLMIARTENVGFGFSSFHSVAFLVRKPSAEAGLKSVIIAIKDMCRFALMANPFILLTYIQMEFKTVKSMGATSNEVKRVAGQIKVMC